MGGCLQAGPQGCCQCRQMLSAEATPSMMGQMSTGHDEEEVQPCSLHTESKYCRWIVNHAHDSRRCMQTAESTVRVSVEVGQ